MWRLCCAAGLCLALGAAAVAAGQAPAERAAATPSGHGFPDPAAARELLAALSPSPALQSFLDSSLREIGSQDPKLLASSPRIAVIDLSSQGTPALAQIRGNERVYPASVVKFVYLMAAYSWQERGRLVIDASLDQQLSEMIRESSNQATRKVFSRLTATEPGPELAPADYALFRDRRLVVKKWLEAIGISDLHTVSPTYDGGGDLFGRDEQFLRDRSVDGALPSRDGQFANRQAMTAAGTARLLALLATDRALTAEDSAIVRGRMKRNIAEQPHLAHRIAGGAAQVPGSEVYSKSGTWGPIYADAGIVRHASGRQFVLAFFTDASPPYRGEAIAELTQRLAEHLFVSLPAGESAP